jgi:hypothetical protein
MRHHEQSQEAHSPIEMAGIYTSLIFLEIMQTSGYSTIAALSKLKDSA